MFMCGAQATADGDLLPQSFTVLPRHYTDMEAAGVVIGKALADAETLGLTRSTGQMVLLGITSWEEFAVIEIDPYVKLQALTSAVVMGYLDTQMRHADKVSQIAGVMWGPPSGAAAEDDPRD